MELVPSGIEKIERDQWVTFLDVSPSESNPTWKVLGVGIPDYALDYNPQVDTEKWIIERNSRSIHKSNEKQGSVTQTCYKGDELFEFVANGRDALNYKTRILDIDAWNVNGDTYPAKMTDGKVVVTSWMGEEAQVEYDLYYDGDATVGTVTFDENNVPTFTATTSL